MNICCSFCHVSFQFSPLSSIWHQVLQYLERGFHLPFLGSEAGSCHLWAVRTRSGDLTFLYSSRGDEGITDITGPLGDWVDVCMMCSREPTTHKASRKAVDSVLGKWRVDPVWGHTPSIPPKDLSQLWMENQWSNEPEDSQDGRKIPQGQFCINKLLLSFCLNFPIFNVGMTVFFLWVSTVWKNIW